MSELLKYLQKYGILLCNANPELPALEDIGCTWGDVTALIDRQELFYCKAYKKRTTYLSRETYCLLKEIRQKKPLTPAAQRIYAILKDGAAVETNFLKEVSGLDAKSYREGFDLLLQNLSVTALHSGKPLNENWSAFLCQTMTERQFKSLTGGR